MAQTLKDELRNRIISAAIQEFKDNGFENASMRSIAENAEMTVGNLYRYFKNKEELYNAITNNTKDSIMKVLQYLDSVTLEKETRVYDVRFSVQDIRRVTDEFVGKMFEVYIKNKSEFLMLINEKEIEKTIVDKFEEMLVKLIKQNYTVEMYEKETVLISMSYACAAFYGMKNILGSDSDNK